MCSLLYAHLTLYVAASIKHIDLSQVPFFSGFAKEITKQRNTCWKHEKEQLHLFFFGLSFV